MWALSSFCHPPVSDMWGGPDPSRAARISGTAYMYHFPSLARHGAAHPVMKIGGLRIMPGPNRQCGQGGSF